MDDFLADETLDLLEARLEGKRGVFEKIFAVGETIAGRYKVERVVGRGNIGRVYQVLDTGTGKHFAIKTVYPRFSGHPDVGPRLEALARRLSGVRHENVVSVLEYGRDHDLLFLKLPWMKARTLESALEATIPAARTRGIPVKQARQALEHAAKALSAAGFDLPHLDLVPKNMFVSPQGLAVADLGLMHAVLPAIEPDDISVMDFREYLAPEISDARAVSAASDTYTMGKVLYRLVTLRHPGRHVTDVPIVGEYPPAVADLIKFATDDAPGARYAHAGALAEAFDDVLHGGPAPSPRASLRVVPAAVAGREAPAPESEAMREAATGLTAPLPGVAAPTGDVLEGETALPGDESIPAAAASTAELDIDWDSTEDVGVAHPHEAAADRAPTEFETITAEAAEDEAMPAREMPGEDRLDAAIEAAETEDPVAAMTRDLQLESEELIRPESGAEEPMDEIIDTAETFPPEAEAFPEPERMEDVFDEVSIEDAAEEATDIEDAKAEAEVLEEEFPRAAETAAAAEPEPVSAEDIESLLAEPAGFEAAEPLDDAVSAKEAAGQAAEEAMEEAAPEAAAEAVAEEEVAEAAKPEIVEEAAEPAAQTAVEIGAAALAAEETRLGAPEAAPAAPEKPRVAPAKKGLPAWSYLAIAAVAAAVVVGVIYVAQRPAGRAVAPATPVPIATPAPATPVVEEAPTPEIPPAPEATPEPAAPTPAATPKPAPTPAVAPPPEPTAPPTPAPPPPPTPVPTPLPGAPKSDLSSTDINAVINAAVGRITYCFSRGIEENPEMSGVATIQFTIEPTGRVSNAVVSASTLGSPVAEECLRRRVMRLHFPAYAGAPKTVRFPFKYSR